jgi:hypothetical protein
MGSPPVNRVPREEKKPAPEEELEPIFAAITKNLNDVVFIITLYRSQILTNYE